TRKASCCDSEWYRQLGCPGSTTVTLIPSCGNENSRVSKLDPEPNDFDTHHCASRTLTTNQPSPAGVSPEPESSSCASATAPSIGGRPKPTVWPSGCGNPPAPTVRRH